MGKETHLLSPSAFKAVNDLANLCMRMYYSFNFIYDILRQDTLLDDVTKEFKTKAKYAQSSAQKCFDFLFLKGKSFMVMEAPWLLNMDLYKAQELQQRFEQVLHDAIQLSVQEKDEALVDFLCDLRDASPKKFECVLLDKDNREACNKTDQKSAAKREKKHLKGHLCPAEKLVETEDVGLVFEADSGVDVESEPPIASTPIKSTQMATAPAESSTFRHNQEEELFVLHGLVNVLILKRPQTPEILDKLMDLIILINGKFPRVKNVFVQESMLQESEVSDHKDFAKLKAMCSIFKDKDTIDLVLVFGGDGSLLFASSLFQGKGKNNPH